MAYNTIKLRGGLESNRSGETPAERELILTTDENKLYAGDGASAGGTEVTVTQVAKNGDVKLEATATGVDVTGTVTADGLTLGDNDKAIFGAGSDLQIYHDGSKSIIHDNGAGQLLVRTDQFNVNSADNTEKLLEAIQNAQVDLYYNNSKKLATTSTGIDVTGTVTADGLTVDSSSIALDATAQHQINMTAYNGSQDATTRIATDRQAGTGSESLMIFYANDGASLEQKMRIRGNGDISFYEDTGTTPKFFWDASAERLGIGTSSPSRQLSVYNSGGDANLTLRTGQSSTGNSQLMFGDAEADNTGRITYAHTDNHMRFQTNGSEAMRIDSSGNLLVGKSSTGIGTTGVELSPSGYIYGTRNGNSLELNRLSTNGAIAVFQKDGTNVGSIGVYAGHVTLGHTDTGLIFNDAIKSIYAFNLSTIANNDNAIDLGWSSVRFQDIYATNGTIQTSDRNEKQDIEELSEAEQRVAVACKGLLRKFRWKDAVAEKGDDARIHFGIIAQDLQDAFAAEGLDAGRYAMFISSTWWEKERVVPAVEAQEAVYETVVVTPAVEAQPAVMGEREVTETVEIGSYINLAGETIVETEERTVTEEVVETIVERQTGEDGITREVEVERTVNRPVMESYEVTPATEAVAEVTEERLVSEAVEAVAEHTVTDTFETLEEAPEGATERTRLGVRYPELLAFIVAAI